MASSGPIIDWAEECEEHEKQTEVAKPSNPWGKAAAVSATPATSNFDFPELGQAPPPKKQEDTRRGSNYDAPRGGDRRGGDHDGPRGGDRYDGPRRGGDYDGARGGDRRGGDNDGPRRGGDYDGSRGGGDRYERRGGDYDAPRREREPLPIPDQPPYTAFVGNLDYQTTENDIGELFETIYKCKVEEIRLPTRPEGGIRGFAYVRFGDRASLETALSVNGEEFVGGRAVKIDVAEASAQDNRRSSFDRRGSRGGDYDNRRNSYDRPPREEESRPERRKLDLNPRTKPLEDLPRPAATPSAAPSEESSAEPAKPKSNPFGEARPRDEAAYEKRRAEEQEKRQKDREERDAKEREERAAKEEEKKRQDALDAKEREETAAKQPEDRPKSSAPSDPRGPRKDDRAPREPRPVVESRAEKSSNWRSDAASAGPVQAPSDRRFPSGGDRRPSAPGERTDRGEPRGDRGFDRGSGAPRRASEQRPYAAPAPAPAAGAGGESQPKRGWEKPGVSASPAAASPSRPPASKRPEERKPEAKESVKNKFAALSMGDDECP